MAIQAEAHGVLGAGVAVGPERTLLPGRAVVGGLERRLAHVGGITAARGELIGPGQVEAPALAGPLRFGTGQSDGVCAGPQRFGGELDPAIGFVVVLGDAARVPVHVEGERMGRRDLREHDDECALGAGIIEAEHFARLVRPPDHVGPHAFFAGPGAGRVVLDEVHVEQADPAVWVDADILDESRVVGHVGGPAPRCVHGRNVQGGDRRQQQGN